MGEEGLANPNQGTLCELQDNLTSDTKKASSHEEDICKKTSEPTATWMQQQKTLQPKYKKLANVNIAAHSCFFFRLEHPDR
jgi:hypothetical protein